MKSLLIIDDDSAFFILLEKVLIPAGFACTNAPDGITGLQIVNDRAFDLIILDIMLPGMSGMKVLTQIRERDKQTPILMLTAKGEESDLVAGLDAGADEYLAKPFRSAELIARINVILRRGEKTIASEQPPAIVVGDMTLQKRGMHLHIRDVEVPVTSTEFKLLEALAESPGIPVSRQSLYMRLFGRKAYPEERALEMLVSRLRKKIGARENGIDRILPIRGEGYILTEPLQ